jgi:NADH-dependent peroxiredoxin subunit F
MNLQRATRSSRPPSPAGLTTGRARERRHAAARTVVLSTGARWRQMNVPGEAEYRNKGVTYCPHCDGPLFKGKRVAVIGGGNSGVEAAIDLAGVVAHVTLLEFDDRCAPTRCCSASCAASPTSTSSSAPAPPRCSATAKVTGLAYDRPHHRRAPHRRPRRRLRPDRPAAQHRVAEGTVELSPRGEVVIDDRGADLGARRVRRRRLHHGALQADRDRHGRRLHRRAQRLRPPDPHVGAPETAARRGADAGGGPVVTWRPVRT